MDPVSLLTTARDFLIYWSPPTIGVVVGGLLIQRYWVARTNESVLIEYFSKELNDLVDETLEYWSLDFSGETNKDKENRQRAKILEQKIKGAIKGLNAALRQYSERYCKKVDFTPLMVEVQDACTGGAFETAKRGPDPARYLSVVNATHCVRWKLLERRV